MSRPTYMTINLTALRHNIERVRKLAPNCSVIAMIKANGYGHGIVNIAKALTSADAFGVASLEEGLKLREAGITQQIVLMEGLFHPDELFEAAMHNFTLVVHQSFHLEILEKATIQYPFSVWLKINTGMHRLGINMDDVEPIYNRLLRNPCVRKPIGWMTHFASADDLESDATALQMQRFNQVIGHLPGPRSLANSAAIIANPSTHGNWVRPGLMLYGASPFVGKTGIDHDLLPVMTLSSRLIAITHINKDGKVGYGGTWTAPEDMRIGVVGVGYGDGYPQFAENGTEVLVNGIVCPLVGRVSMDMLTVDIRKLPQAQINDPVILWGDGLPIERIASHAHTSAYEILTRMTPRPKLEVIE